jgi:hypothetical protein
MGCQLLFSLNTFSRMLNEHKVDEQWVRDFFQMVDRLDPAEYLTHFAKDGQVVFGNQPPVMGKPPLKRP